MRPGKPGDAWHREVEEELERHYAGRLAHMKESAAEQAALANAAKKAFTDAQSHVSDGDEDGTSIELANHAHVSLPFNVICHLHPMNQLMSAYTSVQRLRFQCM